jgi:hypothetical protein
VATGPLLEMLFNDVLIFRRNHGILGPRAENASWSRERIFLLHKKDQDPYPLHSAPLGICLPSSMDQNTTSRSFACTLLFQTWITFEFQQFSISACAHNHLSSDAPYVKNAVNVGWRSRRALTWTGPHNGQRRPGRGTFWGRNPGSGDTHNKRPSLQVAL